MAELSTCPDCHALVYLPAEVDHEATARCPSCNSYFTLGELWTRRPRYVILPVQPQHGTELPQVEYVAADTAGAVLPGIAQSDSENIGTVDPAVSMPIPRGLAKQGSDSSNTLMSDKNVPARPVVINPGSRTKNGNGKQVGWEIIKVLAGGVAGLCIGYLFILWFVGNDLFGISQHFPNWLVPSHISGILK